MADLQIFKLEALVTGIGGNVVNSKKKVTNSYFYSDVTEYRSHVICITCFGLTQNYDLLQINLAPFTMVHISAL
jgi:hypothetical protein